MGDSERLRKLRTRWLRWLGQKTRSDKPYWTTLLGSNWIGWLNKVMEKCGLEINSSVWQQPTREQVKLFYLMGIHSADMEDFRRLDNLYCTDIIEKRGW